MATSIEEAKKCPKCGETGTLGPKMPTAKIGYLAAVCKCYNDRCAWYRTGWTIQFNPDGSIPDARNRTPDDREPRQYPRDDNVLFNQRSEAIRQRAERASAESDDR